MRIIIVVSVIVVFLLLTVGYDLLEGYFKKDVKNQSKPNDLDELKEKAVKVTDNYNSVIEEIKSVEKQVGEIKEKTEVKK
jgi:hypothetical protein